MNQGQPNEVEEIFEFVHSKNKDISAKYNRAAKEKYLNDDRPIIKEIINREYLSLEEYNKRDTEYTSILKSFHLHYGSLNVKNLKLRSCFFWVILLSYIGVLLASFTVIFISLFSDNAVSVVVTSIVSGVVSILSSVILLPQIIAKYLFHENEQKNTIDMMAKFHENDQMIRDSHIKEIEKNDKKNEEDSQSCD